MVLGMGITSPKEPLPNHNSNSCYRNPIYYRVGIYFAPCGFVKKPQQPEFDGSARGELGCGFCVAGQVLICI